MPKIDLPQFTGLRGIAALLVLFFHFRTPEGMELHFGLADSFSRFGMLGVDVFFVLSGFILTHVYGADFSKGPSRAPLRKFATARFSRIYPLHFVTLFMMLGAYAMALQFGVRPTETGGYSWHSVLLSLLLVQEWFGVIAPNPASWSISIEFAAYLLFPFFIGALLRLREHWPILLIVAGALIIEAQPHWRVIRSIAEFVMGCAAYRVAREGLPAWLGPLSGVAFIVPFVASGMMEQEASGLAALCFTLAVVFLAAPSSFDPFKRLCSFRSTIFLGDISYSVYLLQWFIWIGWKHVFARLPFFSAHPYLMIACAAGTVTVCAMASFYLLEKPMKTWLRGKQIKQKTDALLSPLL